MNFTENSDLRRRYCEQLETMNDRLREKNFAAQCETYYQNQIAHTAQALIESGRQIVLLSGPSASGKTTTAQKLAQTLESRFDRRAHVISLDDFFVGKGNYPKLPDGREDFESVDALHLTLFWETVDALLCQGRAMMPQFDFSASVRKDGAYELEVGKRDVVIFEGIHALNPRLMPADHGKDAYRVYVSPKCQVCRGDALFFPSRDLRLVRRMVRDRLFRAYTFSQTAKIWDNVCAGERENILPFSSMADSVIDTTHGYEYGLYVNYLQDAVSDADPIVRDMAEKIGQFVRISPAAVPSDSMIREFIGKGESI